MAFWFNRNRNSKDIPATTTLKDVDDPVILHKHDLAKWNYLGFVKCSYVDQKGKITEQYSVFLFVSKNNEKRRSYHIPDDVDGYVERGYRYIQNRIKPWAAGEGIFYDCIFGEQSFPSDYLKEYMLGKFRAVWDPETNWWSVNDQSKYNSANKQQRGLEGKGVKPTPVPGSNVVTVEFGNPLKN